MKYYISKTLANSTVKALRPKVEEALKAEGFGVLTEIDLQAVMKAKLDKDYLPHIILGACSPVYADKVLSIDPNMSTLLPCNVTLRELETGGVEVIARQNEQNGADGPSHNRQQRAETDLGVITLFQRFLFRFGQQFDLPCFGFY